MADWGWERVAQFPGNGSGWYVTGGFIVQDNKLWFAAFTEGKVYYSSNGTDYTEDPLWPGGAPRDLVTFNGFLYALRDSTQLYRRDVTQWTLVGTAQAENGYNPYFERMWADDTAGHIMIGGSVYDAGAPSFQHRKARVWSYNEAEGLLVDLTLGTDTDYIVDVCYFDGDWYGSVYRTVGGGHSYPWRILKRVGVENWAGDFAWDNLSYVYPHKFGVHETGAYVYDSKPLYTSKIIRKPSSDEPWERMTHPAWGGGTCLLFYGADKVLTNRHQVANEYAYALNEDTDTWYTTGLNVLRIDDFISFGTCIYAACYDSPSYAIWRACWKNQLGPARIGDSKSLVCDHEYGDTIYLGLLETSNKPMIMWVDWDFADYMDPAWRATSGGSWVSVNTPETRNICIGYGNVKRVTMFWNRQVVISPPWRKGAFWSSGRFGNSEVVTTLEYHPTAGSADLVATRRDNQDWIKSSYDDAFMNEIWTDMGDIPFVARSQLRVGDDIWIGNETGGSSVVRLLSGGSGNDWVDKSVGLPNVPINDLESA